MTRFMVYVTFGFVMLVLCACGCITRENHSGAMTINFNGDVTAPAGGVCPLIAANLYAVDCTATQDASKKFPINAVNPVVDTEPGTASAAIDALAPAGAAVDVLPELEPVE